MYPVVYMYMFCPYKSCCFLCSSYQGYYILVTLFKNHDFSHQLHHETTHDLCEAISVRISTLNISLNTEF